MITFAEVWNFYCYRGRFELKLGAGVYGVVAEHEDNQRRSNWIGKTSLLIALGPFPLFGQHDKRTEDEWITDGEDEGGVMLRMADGSRVKRWRKRGAKTLLEYVNDEGRLFVAEAAQAEICRVLGLTWADFENTSFFEQKQMARFVRARPGDRQQVVTDWMQLGPLQRAGARALKAASDAFDQRDRLEAERQTLLSRVAELAKKAGVEGADVDAVNAKLEPEECAKRTKRDEEAIALKALYDQRSKAEQYARLLGDKSAWEEATANRQAIEAQLAKLEPTDEVAVARARRELNDANAEHGAAMSDLRDRRKLSLGQFDGACPVSKGFDCPAKSEINARSAENKKAYEESEAASAITIARVNEKDNALANLLASSNDRARLAAKLEEAKKREAAAMPAELPGELVEAPDAEEYAAVTMRIRVLDEEIAAIRQMRTSLEEIALRLPPLEERIASVRTRAEVAKMGAIILGRNGAQRKISEEGLDEIQELANESFLSDAGIALGVRIEWARETKGLATNCEQCGATFPTSTKVKICERCKADRGPKLDEKLNLSLTNRSGAAEDMAGIALQLAASAWLRGRRASRWSVAYIDEPFGALDDEHRQAVATFIATALPARFGYSQIFVVAHNRGIMNALPARLRVIGTRNGSMVEVERS